MKKQYVEIGAAEKLALLQKHSALGPAWKGLDDKQWCLHCEKQFSGQAVRVYKEEDPGLWRSSAGRLAVKVRPWIGGMKIIP